MIATRSTTTDHIDLESCTSHGVAVATVASYGNHIVAEHTFALLLALTRRLREAMRLNGDKPFSYEALCGTELHGETRAFGTEVIAHDIKPRPAEAARPGFVYVSFDELLRRSHFLGPTSTSTLRSSSRSESGSDPCP